MLHAADKIEYSLGNRKVKYDEGEIPIFLSNLIFDIDEKLVYTSDRFYQVKFLYFNKVYHRTSIFIY